MMEQDRELRKLLDQWEAPAPGAALDDRVLSSFRRHSQRQLRWFRIAAGLLLAASTFYFWQNGRAGKSHSGDPSLETRVNARGFMPLANGAITVVKIKLETNQ